MWYLPDTRAEGTLGRLLQDGAPAVKIFGEEIDVKAHIETLDGISGHADRDGLLTWAAAFEQKPKYVFVVHGNDESCESLTDALNTQLGLTAKAPYSGSEFDLIKGVWIKETEPVPVEAETQATRKATGVYTRLVDAGQMLMDVIARNQGGANQDLTRFTEQILALCEKEPINNRSTEKNDRSKDLHRWISKRKSRRTGRLWSGHALCG